LTPEERNSTKEICVLKERELVVNLEKGIQQSNLYSRGKRNKLELKYFGERNKKLSLDEETVSSE
jgi:hypothetical protein